MMVYTRFNIVLATAMYRGKRNADNDTGEIRFNFLQEHRSSNAVLWSKKRRYVV